MNTPKQTANLKKEILIRLIKAYLSDNFEENTRLIPYDMRPKGSEVPYRCCIYKERAVLRDRAIAGLGSSIEETNDSTLLSEVAKMLKTEKTGRTPINCSYNCLQRLCTFKNTRN